MDMDIENKVIGHFTSFEHRSVGVLYFAVGKFFLNNNNKSHTYKEIKNSKQRKTKEYI